MESKKKKKVYLIREPLKAPVLSMYVCVCVCVYIYIYKGSKINGNCTGFMMGRNTERKGEEARSRMEISDRTLEQRVLAPGHPGTGR